MNSNLIKLNSTISGLLNTLKLSLLYIFLPQSSICQIVEWSEVVGNDSSYVEITDVACDPENNIYTIGYFNGVIDLDPSEAEYLVGSVEGSSDCFVQKLDADGNFLWGLSYGGTTTDKSYAIVVNEDSDILITGIFSGIADFLPGPGIELLFSFGYWDTFLLKMSSEGEFNWVKQFGGSDFQMGQSLSVDDDNNIILVGSHRGTTDFDPGPEFLNIIGEGVGETANYACFILKTTQDGDLIWVNSYNGLGYPNSASTNFLQGKKKTDSDNSIYLTGRFYETTDFDLSDEIEEHTPIAGSDIFILKIDGDGDFKWVKVLGSIGHDGGTEVHITDDGVCLTTGFFKSDFDIDPGDELMIVTNKGSSDGYILALDGDGEYLWHNNYGSFENETKQKIFEAGENIYSAFVFKGELEVKIGGGILKRSATGDYDLCLLRLNESGEVTGLKQVGNQYNNSESALTVSNASDIYLTGHFRDTLNIGLDSLYSYGEDESGFVVKMNDCEWITTDTLIISSCNSFFWEKTNQSYFESGIYVAIKDGAEMSCDSLFVLNLEIIGNETHLIDTATCYNYTTPSGHEIIFESGFYTDTLIAESGCDSVLGISLTIYNTEPEITRIENNLMVDIEEANYQWVKCAPEFEILIGEENQIFTASENGSYAVIVTQNECSDTSACFLVADVKIDNIDLENHIWSIYPNPTKQQITIKISGQTPITEVIIFDLFGQIVLRKQITFENNEVHVNIEDISSGTYYVSLSFDDNNRILKKLIKL